jgi:hypothetical protein
MQVPPPCSANDQGHCRRTGERTASRGSSGRRAPGDGCAGARRRRGRWQGADALHAGWVPGRQEGSARTSCRRTLHLCWCGLPGKKHQAHPVPVMAARAAWQEAPGAPCTRRPARAAWHQAPDPLHGHGPWWCAADENFLADAAADEMRSRLRDLASQVVDLQVCVLGRPGTG